MNRFLCLGCVLACTAGVTAADTVISYTSCADPPTCSAANTTETRWGAIYGLTGDPNGGLVEPRAGWNGGWSNGHGFFQIGIFDITGFTVATTPRVLLRIPEQNRGGNPADYDLHTLYCYHIIPASSSTISFADADSAAISGPWNGLVGITTDSFHPKEIGIYRPKNSGSTQDDTKYTEFDVTDAVHLDITAGRTTFAFRIQHNQDELYTGYRRFVPLPSMTQTTITNPISLIIKELGTAEGPCNDGIDNDGDGQIDCADSDCQASQYCPETCNNGVDDNANGLVDCADPRCVGNPACPEVACSDGQDNDGDGNIDCADSDCSASPACPENCSNGVDDDANGLIDCADPDCSSTFSCGGYTCIKPASAQDGYVIAGTTNMNTSGGFDCQWGAYNEHPWVSIGLHSLPAGITAAQIGTATLRVPQTDNAWTGDSYALDLDMDIKHIDAASDTTVSLADGDSAALGDIGVYRLGGPYVGNNSRYKLYNVTQAVKADATAGRQTFAWRIEPQAIADTSHQSARYFPSVDNTDGAFSTANPPPQFGPTDNHGAVLCILAPGLTEDSCTDGIDNDNDGETDCQDEACTDDPACPETCNNGVDDDGNGLVDCSDPECLASPACPEAVCGDGIDNDNDGKTDCADTDCFGATACRSEAGYCADGEDNDNDCLEDGSDPDCVGSRVVRPTFPQDGQVYVALNSAENSNAFCFYGSYGGAGLNPVGIHTLPAGVSAGSVGVAKLQIPRTDNWWSADQSATTLTLRAKHIDADNDSQVTVPDGTSAPLDDIGLYRNPGPAQTSGSAFVEYDVTGMVQADITAGLATFAWRVEPESVPEGQSSQFYFPPRENTDNFFPAFNRGARLIVSVIGEYEAICDDSVDNDGDGKVDCADADCYSNVTCAVNEICGDGLDNNGNGLSDCQDTACVGSPCCAPPVEICTNGVDDTGDGLVDCADPQCQCAPNCGGPQPENCTDGIDNDCNEQTDCQDSACAINPACLDCNNPYADADDDGDVDVDDFSGFQLCFAGPGAPTPAGCGCYDRNVDGHVDQTDFEAWKLCASRAYVTADTNCDGAP